MKILAWSSLAAVLLLSAGTACFAQVLKGEPASGTVKTGQKVLVDDGTCGPGKIKEVTGGSNNPSNPIRRSSRCIARK